MISKKELLKETGISYGQLYRWKREHLIPEEWFIKQSSFTGQETFLPREKTIKRINEILELKDKYSLEDLAKRFSPTKPSEEYNIKDIERIKEVNPQVLQICVQEYKKEVFQYIEIAYMVVVSDLMASKKIEAKDIVEIIKALKTMEINEIKQLSTLIICVIKNAYFAVLKNGSANLIFDDNVKIVDAISLDDLSNRIKYEFVD